VFLTRGLEQRILAEADPRLPNVPAAGHPADRRRACA
jgi:hypothetical protein